MIKYILYCFAWSKCQFYFDFLSTAQNLCRGSNNTKLSCIPVCNVSNAIWICKFFDAVLRLRNMEAILISREVYKKSFY